MHYALFQHRWSQILAARTHVVLTVYVVPQALQHTARVALACTRNRQLVDHNVAWILIAHNTLHATMRNVETPARALVRLKLIVVFVYTPLYALVLRCIPATHLQDVSQVKFSSYFLL